MKQLTATTTIRHDGETYAEGATFEATDKEAKALVEAGVAIEGAADEAGPTEDAGGDKPTESAEADKPTESAEADKPAAPPGHPQRRNKG